MEISSCPDYLVFIQNFYVWLSGWTLTSFSVMSNLHRLLYHIICQWYVPALCISSLFLFHGFELRWFSIITIWKNYLMLLYVHACRSEKITSVLTWHALLGRNWKERAHSMKERRLSSWATSPLMWRSFSFFKHLKCKLLMINH